MTKKLNILFLCGWYPSKVFPTNGDFIQRHAEAVSTKHDISVIHIVSDKNCKKNIETTFIEINDVKTHIAYVKQTKNPILKLIWFWKSYLVLLKKINQFDVVHLNEIFPFGLFALHLKWFYKKPFIITEHFTGYLEASKLKISFFEKLISKRIVKKAYAIATVSNYLTKNMQNLGFKGNFVTVPNVVDTDLFLPKKKEHKTLKLVHVSSLKDNHKNISGMLRVAKLLEDKLDYFEWNFIGNNGDDYQEYLRTLDLKKGKISFIEHQTQKELVSNLQNASVCISFSNYETFGIVITEAIACGTPVIATNTGIAIDFKELDFCKVIPIKNEELLFNEILNSKNTFANIDTDVMHTFIKQQYNKEVVLDKFSLLYYQSLKK
ncbi:MAG: glycosyltransferase family 4 protein [Polaribacter sp.]|uniref:glycosyltransferase family 4 protein n=1 Tax=Polaribacter sp. TaxID=1920175 RepID=UPI002F359B95